MSYNLKNNGKKKKNTRFFLKRQINGNFPGGKFVKIGSITFWIVKAFLFSLWI